MGAAVREDSGSLLSGNRQEVGVISWREREKSVYLQERDFFNLKY